MNSINWRKSQYFKRSEFNPKEVDYIDPNALKRYNTARGITDVSWYPSREDGALARFSGSKTSRHYAVDRLSDALDFFIAKNTDILWFLYKLYGSSLFGGIGVYFDTRGYNYSSDIMFHVDCRKCMTGYPLVWFRDKGKYTYVVNNNKSLNELIDKIKEYK